MSQSSSFRRFVHHLWECWKVIAHVIGNFQARVLLTVFYFVMVPPFALLVRLVRDPLSLRVPTGTSYWIPRAPSSDPSQAGRQF